MPHQPKARHGIRRTVCEKNHAAVSAVTMANALQHFFVICSFKNNARHAENSANIALNANDFLQVIPLDDVTLLRGGTALVESSAGETFATLSMMQRVHIF